jgi:hypothetical protein
MRLALLAVLLLCPRVWAQPKLDDFGDPLPLR